MKFTRFPVNRHKIAEVAQLEAQVFARWWLVLVDAWQKWIDWTGFIWLGFGGACESCGRYRVDPCLEFGVPGEHGVQWGRGGEGSISC